MNNLTNIRHIIEGNWNELQGEIQSNWGKLTDDDIEKINGSYKKLTGKLAKLYGYNASKIEKEISEFIEAGDFENIIEKSSNQINNINEIVLSKLNDYFQTAKQKSEDAEKKVVNYVSDNPYKTISIAATAGILIGYLLNRKHD